jgi:hypothetical protein
MNLKYKEIKMYSNTTLKDLIDWLEEQDPDKIVSDGFGFPHSDRGSYDELAFEPIEEITFGEMLSHAKSALNKTFTGYKGGDYKMTEYTPVYIGKWGCCGDAITPIHFKYWKLSSR